MFHRKKAVNTTNFTDEICQLVDGYIETLPTAIKRSPLLVNWLADDYSRFGIINSVRNSNEEIRRAVKRFSSSKQTQWQMAKWLVATMLSQNILNIITECRNGERDNLSGVKLIKQYVEFSRAQSRALRITLDSRSDNSSSKLEKMLNQLEKKCAQAILYLNHHSQPEAQQSDTKKLLIVRPRRF